MEKKEEIYTNLCISVHNLDISLNENIQQIINETVDSVYNKISNMISKNYKNVLFNGELEGIIKQSFDEEKNKYLNKYDSINLEDIKSNDTFNNYIDKQEEKVSYDEQDIVLLSNKISKEIEKYLKEINYSNLFYQRDVVEINKKINSILLKEIESYYLKSSKTNIVTKSAIDKVYNDISTNYSIYNNLEVSKTR